MNTMTVRLEPNLTVTAMINGVEVEKHHLKTPEEALEVRSPRGCERKLKEEAK
jgi:hypothetical protein